MAQPEFGPWEKRGIRRVEVISERSMRRKAKEKATQVLIKKMAFAFSGPWTRD